MANKKKEYNKPGLMTERKRNIIQGLLQEYNIESAAVIREALKDLLGGTIKEMMEAEMDEHLGYEKPNAPTAMMPGTGTKASGSRRAMGARLRPGRDCQGQRP